MSVIGLRGVCLYAFQKLRIYLIVVSSFGGLICYPLVSVLVDPFVICLIILRNPTEIMLMVKVSCLLLMAIRLVTSQTDHCGTLDTLSAFSFTLMTQLRVGLFTQKGDYSGFLALFLLESSLLLLEQEI